MSRFLDIEAQLDSENDYEDDEDEVESAAQDDDDFIDDSIRPESFIPPPPLPELEERFAFAESRYTSSKPREPQEDDPVYTRSLEKAQSKGMTRVLQDRQFVFDILKRAENPENRTFNHATGSRAPIPPDAMERYGHFLRPKCILDPQAPPPSDSASTNSHPPSSSTAIPTLDPPLPSSDALGIPAAHLKRKLADLSVSSAPHGTFVRKKPRLDVDMKGWSQWAAGKRQHAPDKDIRRREIAPGEWVKVSRGLYKGDIGIVWKPDSTSSGKTGYFLLLIPRLAARNSKKGRRERPAPSRFRPEAFGSEPKKGEEPRTFRFRDKTFSHGLLVKFFEERSLETVYFAPSEVHDEFSKSKHPFVRTFPFPLPDFYAFEVGDRVEAAGQVGKVTEVSADMCLVDYGDAGMHTSPSRLLQKHIVPGDSIRVVVGEHEGQEGLVAERHGSLLYVSQRHSKTGIDFFVHINSVRVQPETFNGALPEDVPWIDTRVVISRGRYSEMQGY
ncbi:transcription elongation factor spt5, partial [Marasmius crinis-equi]